MSKLSLVERSRSAAQRSAGEVSVETSRAWHRENLERELGRPEGGWGQREIVPADGLVTMLTRPLTLVLFTFFLFIAILSLMLWRDGVIDDFLGLDEPQAHAPKRRWVLGKPLPSEPPAEPVNEPPPWPDPYAEEAPPAPSPAKDMNASDTKAKAKAMQ